MKDTPSLAPLTKLHVTGPDTAEEVVLLYSGSAVSYRLVIWQLRRKSRTSPWASEEDGPPARVINGAGWEMVAELFGVDKDGALALMSLARRASGS